MAVSLLLAGLPVSAAGAGDIVTNESRAPAAGITWDTLTGTEGETVRRIQQITFSAAEGAYAVMPFYGDNLTSRHTLTQMAQLATDQGFEVVAAVNGDFFYTEGEPATGMPHGPLIRNGQVICTEDFPPNLNTVSSRDWKTIGFKADGTAVSGHFTTRRTVSWTSGGEPKETNITVMNRQLINSGLHLYTGAFGDTVTNTSGFPLYAVTLSVQQGNFLFGQDTVCRVEYVDDGITEAVIPAGQVVLCAADNWLTEEKISFLRELRQGQQITISITPEDEQWNGVIQAISGPNALVRDGAVTTVTTAIPENYPSTMVGVTPEGTVYLTQIDGRGMGGSYGIGPIAAGEYMQSLGCTNALLFDGGGSSEMVVRSGSSFVVVNRPSDGQERAIGTCLLLVRTPPLVEGVSAAADNTSVPWIAAGVAATVMAAVTVAVLLIRRRKPRSMPG